MSTVPYDAVNRRDLDALLALTDPGAVAIPRLLEVEGGALHGHEGVRTWWESIFGAFPDFGIRVLEVRAIGATTVCRLQAHGRGVGSEVPFEDAIWNVTEWRDGKGVWWQTFRSEADALEAARLRDSR